MIGTYDRSGPTPATNKPFEVRGVSIGELQQGKIRRNTDYWNMAEFPGAIGMLPAPLAAASS
ncbi:MAG: hypothetical protein JO020_22465 [Chloroflexi bacterium]|nr:hypothetical protein [Chloroflexota bacterium]MBV9896937.1 hypothetical protein [Chloroflexota bacterium]